MAVVGKQNSFNKHLTYIIKIEVINFFYSSILLPVI